MFYTVSIHVRYSFARFENISINGFRTCCGKINYGETTVMVYKYIQYINDGIFTNYKQLVKGWQLKTK